MEDVRFQYKSLKYWIEDGIICSTFTQKTFLELEMAKKGVEIQKTLRMGMTMPLLVDIRNLSGASAEARKYFASQESISEVTAGALIVKSSFTEWLGNFFFKISKPAIPKRIFQDHEKAKQWLNQYPARMRAL